MTDRRQTIKNGDSRLYGGASLIFENGNFSRAKICPQAHTTKSEGRTKSVFHEWGAPHISGTARIEKGRTKGAGMR